MVASQNLQAKFRISAESTKLYGKRFFVATRR
jgi:hypothetical protein